MLAVHKAGLHLLQKSARSIRNSAHLSTFQFFPVNLTASITLPNDLSPASNMTVKGSLPFAASSTTPTLSGPRGLAAWQQRQKEAGTSEKSTEEGNASNPFLSMLAGGALQAGVQLPPMGYTENGSWTYTQSGNPCLDFFFQIVADTPPERLRSLLEEAWKEDSLLALKLLFHLRGVRGTGKSEKGGFYTGGLWLAEKHPGTLLANLKQVGVFGYYKDLLEIVLR
jgi:hypothetical protein